MLEKIVGPDISHNDIKSFETALVGAGINKFGPLGSRFKKKDPIFVVRAPARLDCMGGIADYSGSLVCEMPLERAVVLGIQARDDRKVVIHSTGINDLGLSPDLSCSLDFLTPESKTNGYLTLKNTFSQQTETAWGAYVPGAFSVLQHEGFIDRFPHGATIVLAGDIPPRIGISSSAAVEIATMYGLSLLYGIKLNGIDMAILSHKVENQIVGAACGIMDQVTCALGEKGKLLSLLCQPHNILGQIVLPPGIHLIGINSGVKRQIKSSRYTNTRIGSFMGLTMIQNYLKTKNRFLSKGRLDYLCNISKSEYLSTYRPLLPVKISGREFQKLYTRDPDPATFIDPAVQYNVRSRVEHPIYEHQRALDFTDHIRKATIEKPEILEKAGRLMYASNWSYTYRCGLGCPQTDWIVSKIRKHGSKSGFYGAKITGGGSGGTVAVLVNDHMFDFISTILDDYKAVTGITAEIFTGSSPGALEFGYLVYRLT